jgi:hypothetical protein
VFVEPGIDSERTPRWARSLNPSQLAAASHAEGSLLIVAGAGTGKTGTLAARVARLIDDGSPNSNPAAHVHAPGSPGAVGPRRSVG